jgi:hypothetical protein
MLTASGIDVDAIAPLVEGKFMSAFVRAHKPVAETPQEACCSPTSSSPSVKEPQAASACCALVEALVVQVQAKHICCSGREERGNGTADDAGRHNLPYP